MIKQYKLSKDDFIILDNGVTVYRMIYNEPIPKLKINKNDMGGYIDEKSIVENSIIGYNTIICNSTIIETNIIDDSKFNLKDNIFISDSKIYGGIITTEKKFNRTLQFTKNSTSLIRFSNNEYLHKKTTIKSSNIINTLIHCPTSVINSTILDCNLFDSILSDCCIVKYNILDKELKGVNIYNKG